MPCLLHPCAMLDPLLSAGLGLADVIDGALARP